MHSSLLHGLGYLLLVRGHLTTCLCQHLRWLLNSLLLKHVLHYLLLLRLGLSLRVEHLWLRLLLGLGKVAYLSRVLGHLKTAWKVACLGSILWHRLLRCRWHAQLWHLEWHLLLRLGCCSHAILLHQLLLQLGQLLLGLWCWLLVCHHLRLGHLRLGGALSLC